MGKRAHFAQGLECLFLDGTCLQSLQKGKTMLLHLRDVRLWWRRELRLVLKRAWVLDSERFQLWSSKLCGLCRQAQHPLLQATVPRMWWADVVHDVAVRQHEAHQCCGYTRPSCDLRGLLQINSCENEASWLRGCQLLHCARLRNGAIRVGSGETAANDGILRATAQKGASVF